MSRMRGPWLLGALASTFLFALPAIGGMFMRVDTPEEAIKLWNVDQEGNGIYHGKIVNKEVLSVYLADSGPENVEVTRLTIDILDEVSLVKADTGKAQKRITVVYRGGVSYRTTAQPSDVDTKVGSEVVVFLTGNPYADLFPQDKWLAGLNSVFLVKESQTGRKVVLGKGDGMAVAQNSEVRTVLQQHADALVNVRRQGR